MKLLLLVSKMFVVFFADDTELVSKTSFVAVSRDLNKYTECEQKESATTYRVSEELSLDTSWLNRSIVYVFSF